MNAFINLEECRESMIVTNKESVLMAPLRLEKIRVSYQRIGEEEVDLTTIFDQETIDAIKDSLITIEPMWRYKY